MDSYNKLKEIDIKNRTSYYFDGITKTIDFYFDNVLIDEKSHENVLVYEIPYQILIGAKRLRIRFDKMEGFTRAYDGARYLVLFGREKHDFIYNKIRCLIGVKNYARIKVDSYDSLPLEETLTFHIVTIQFNSV